MRNNWIDKFLKDRQSGGLERDFQKGATAFLQETRKLPSYRNDPVLMEQTTKEGTDFVTGADQLMQVNLKKALLRSDEYSGVVYGFWGEEEPDNTIDWQSFDRVWVSDPIEGTINYSGKRGNRDGDWGSVLSLIDTKANQPLIGFVIDPVNRELTFAVKGNGAYRVILDEDWQDGEIIPLTVQ